MNYIYKVATPLYFVNSFSSSATTSLYLCMYHPTVTYCHVQINKMQEYLHTSLHWKNHTNESDNMANMLNLLELQIKYVYHFALYYSINTFYRSYEMLVWMDVMCLQCDPIVETTIHTYVCLCTYLFIEYRTSLHGMHMATHTQCNAAMAPYMIELMMCNRRVLQNYILLQATKTCASHMHPNMLKIVTSISVLHLCTFHSCARHPLTQHQNFLTG